MILHKGGDISIHPKCVSLHLYCLYFSYICSYVHLWLCTNLFRHPCSCKIFGRRVHSHSSSDKASKEGLCGVQWIMQGEVEWHENVSCVFTVLRFVFVYYWFYFHKSNSKIFMELYSFIYIHNVHVHKDLYIMTFCMTPPFKLSYKQVQMMSVTLNKMK